jgi:hypothetical protein
MATSSRYASRHGSKAGAQWWLPCAGVALTAFSAAWVAWPTVRSECRPTTSAVTAVSAEFKLQNGAAGPASGDGAMTAQSFTTGVPAGQPTAPADAKYTVKLRSDTTGRSWTGTEHIAFTNPGTVPLEEFWIRLWGNSVAGCGPVAAERVGAVTGGRVAELSADCTAVRIVLDHPVAPKASGSVGFDLAIDVPERQDRFGSFGGFTFLGDALATLAVKDEHGWELPPYTAFGESFYSLTADYDVTLDHPSALLTPSSGYLESETQRDGRTVDHLLAPKVRDFSWSIGAFRKQSMTTADGVEVDAYWAAGLGDARCESLMADASDALTNYSARFGVYPYRRFSIVFDDFGTSFDGMEYPNYVLSSPYQGAVSHEVAHQWWFALVGDDQYRHPWLDEAFTEYSAEQFQGLTVPGHHCDWLAPDERMDATMATYEAGGDPMYHDAIYHEGTCMLFDLQSVIGKDAMNDFLRTLVQRYEYGVVRPADVRAVAQSVTDKDLSSFWAKWRDNGD